MIPEQLPKKASYAEKKVFKKLKKLPDDYIVIYSLGLSKHIKKIQGEIDFVIICKRGILCLEVKGGKVTRENGIWNVEARNGHKNQIENPFLQASDNMYSLRNYLIEKMKNEFYKENILFACAVVIPDTYFEAEGPDINSNELINTKKLKEYDIKEFIYNVFLYYNEKYQAKYLQSKTNLTKTMIDKITIILRGNLGYAKSLSFDLEETLRTLIELTEEQKEILDKMIENDRIIIKGTGGTGKTVLLYEQTLRLAALGYKVIFVCYNKSLSQYLNNMLGNLNNTIKENIRISTLHAYMLEQLKMAQTEYAIKNTEEYFKEEVPQDFLQINNEKYDVMLIDEAQDILNSTYVKCLEKILNGGLKDGSWYMCVDEKQNLYNNTELQELLHYIKNEIRPTITRLTKNCRNTKQISNFNYELTNIEQSTNENIYGNDVQKITYRYNNNQQDEVRNIIKNLQSQGIRNSEVVILSKRPYKYSVFEGRNFLEDMSTKIEIIGEYNNRENTNEYIRFSTIRKFKGLECNVVILCDVDSVNDEESRMLNYVAVSRAKTLLYVLYKEGVSLHAIDKSVNNDIEKLVDQLLHNN